MTIDNVSGGELIDPVWGNAVADAINLDQTPLTVTGITPNTNWTTALSMRTLGGWAVMSVTITRDTSNIGATEAVLATVEAAGRGTFAGFTQVLPQRATSSPTALSDAICYYNASTGQVSVKWLNTWNIGVSATFQGTVYLGL